MRLGMNPTWQAGLAGAGLIWAEIAALAFSPWSASTAPAAFFPLGGILTLAFLWLWERDRRHAPRYASQWAWGAAASMVLAWLSISQGCHFTLRFLPFGPGCADMAGGQAVLRAAFLFAGSVGMQAHALRISLLGWLLRNPSSTL